MIRLLVLGILFEHNVHGYEIFEKAKIWGADRWGDVKRGSIYHCLKQLVKEELAICLGTERDGNRPERMSYAITQQGREVFIDLLKQCLATPGDPTTLYFALAFAANLPDQVASTCLLERRKALSDTVKVQRSNVLRWRVHEPTLSWMNDALTHGIVRMEAEIRWIDQALGRVDEYPIRDWNRPVINL